MPRRQGTIFEAMPWLNFVHIFCDLYTTKVVIHTTSGLNRFYNAYCARCTEHKFYRHPARIIFRTGFEQL